jgi:hypothetical protein
VNRFRERLGFWLTAAGVFLAVVSIVVSLLVEEIRHWWIFAAWPDVLSVGRGLIGLYLALGDWRYQVGVLGVALALGFGLTLIWVMSLLRRSRIELGRAESERTRATDQRDQARQLAALKETELERLERLRKSMIALDQATISEMLAPSDDPTAKRAAGIQTVLYAVRRNLAPSVPHIRMSFVECVRGGHTRAVPFPLSPRQVTGNRRRRYNLRVIKHLDLKHEEFTDIESLSDEVGLANRAIATGRMAYVHRTSTRWRPRTPAIGGPTMTSHTSR